MSRGLPPRAVLAMNVRRIHTKTRRPPPGPSPRSLRERGRGEEGSVLEADGAFHGVPDRAQARDLELVDVRRPDLPRDADAVELLEDVVEERARLEGHELDVRLAVPAEPAVLAAERDRRRLEADDVDDDLVGLEAEPRVDVVERGRVERGLAARRLRDDERQS